MSNPMFPSAGPQHQWLTRLVGEWTCEAECVMEPGSPPMKTTARETVRAIGDLWIIGESEGQMPGGGTMTAIITVGYDPVKKKFIGTWVGSPMTTLFIYEGELDAAQKVLPLNTTGPSFTDPTKTARFQDVIDIISRNDRLLWSQMQDELGQWHRFMTARYTRVK